MNLDAIKTFVISVLRVHESTLRDLAAYQTAFLELAAFVAAHDQYRLPGAATARVHPANGVLTVKTSTRGHLSLFFHIAVARGTDTWEVDMNLPVRGAYGDGIFCVDLGVIRVGAVPLVRIKNQSILKIGFSFHLRRLRS